MTPSTPRAQRSHHEIGDLAQLIFDWPIRRAPRLSLPFFILMAVIAQAFIMMVFSIDYKIQQQPPPSSPRIYFVPEDSTVARQLTPWLEANDPAVFSPLHAAREGLPSRPRLNYRPSYEDPPPPLRPLAMEEQVISEPPGIPPTDMVASKKFKRSIGTMSVPKGVALSTLVQWEDDLAPRAAALKTAAPGSADSAPQYHPVSALQPSLYQLEVGEEGIPLHCILLESSGSSEADEEGRVWVMGRRLPATDRSSWGHVRIQWAVAPQPSQARP